MSESINCVNAKEKINNYTKYCNEHHLNNGNVLITQYKLTSRDFHSLLKPSGITNAKDLNEVCIKFALAGKSDDNQLELVLSGLVEIDGKKKMKNELYSLRNDYFKGKIQTSKGDIDVDKLEDLIFNDKKKSIPKPIIQSITGKDYSLINLLKDLGEYLKNTPVDENEILFHEHAGLEYKTQGLIISEVDLEKFKIFDASIDKELALIAVLVSTKNDGVTKLAKPYFTLALVEMVNDVIQDSAREYFSPCPKNCPEFQPCTD